MKRIAIIVGSFHEDICSEVVARLKAVTDREIILISDGKEIKDDMEFLDITKLPIQMLRREPIELKINEVYRIDSVENGKNRRRRLRAQKRNSKKGLIPHNNVKPKYHK